MAKKEVSALMAKVLKNSSLKNSSVLSQSEIFNNKDRVSTDVPIINMAFSAELNGGITNGLTILAGEEACFKTNIALKCVQAYLDKYPDAICMFFDNEGGATPEYLESQGINPDRVAHIFFEDIEELKTEMVIQLNGLSRGDKVIMVIDSVGNAASKKELDDAEAGKSVTDMTRAKSIKSLFRMITVKLVAKDIPCIAICHVYASLDLYSKPIISGGKGLAYSANQSFIISKSQEKVDKDIIGYNFTITTRKSRFVRQESKFPFKVLYGTGICKYSGLLDVAIDLGFVVKPVQGWYSRVDDDGVVETKKWRAKDTDCSEFWDMLLNSKKFDMAIQNRYKLSKHEQSEYDNSDEETDIEEVDTLE